MEKKSPIAHASLTGMLSHLFYKNELFVAYVVKQSDWISCFSLLNPNLLHNFFLSLVLSMPCYFLILFYIFIIVAPKRLRNYSGAFKFQIIMKAESIEHYPATSEFSRD